MSRPLVIAVGAALVLGAGQTVAQQPRFDHERHHLLFPTCTSCHVEPATGAGSLYPDPAMCASCHDGTIQPRVSWEPPGPRRTNLRFDHALAAHMAPKNGVEPPKCVDCHERDGTTWMAVDRVNFKNCLGCHGVKTEHLAAPDSACSVCHFPLAQAKDLTREDVAAFPAPPSHHEHDWASLHGRAARSGEAGAQVAASCATCHAREFCLTCHVDAPERPAIQAMPADPRSTAISVRISAPASHQDATFLTRHGAAARRAPAQCSTCHARESCLTCHAGTPRVAARIPARGPGRGVGVVLERRPPAFHGASFADDHRAMALSEPATCGGCHVRADCLDCHRPGAGAGTSYHPAGFLARHPAAAYARETSCSECHNTAGFCADCHKAAGLVSTGPLRPGYHDANGAFIVGHGQAARQSLETCVSCHAERDCLTCHSALGGRRFDPHGPGFDAAQLLRKNPQMCTVCHGTAIPTP